VSGARSICRGILVGERSDTGESCEYFRDSYVRVLQRVCGQRVAVKSCFLFGKTGTETLGNVISRRRNGQKSNVRMVFPFQKRGKVN